MNTSCQLQSFSVRYFPDILLPPCAFTLALSTLPFIPRKALPTLLSYHHHLSFFHFLASPSFVGFPLFRSCSTTLAAVTHHIMEPQQHYNHHQQLQQQQLQHNEENSGGGSKGSFLCRQTSTRWTPTSDQIRILKELYYKNGIRSPTTEQIQRISARLRQYGKIEGKNVFYWFQNHKARERQKKKFTTDVPMHPRSTPTTTTVANAAAWKPADHHDYSFHCSKYPNISPHPGFSSGPNSSTGGVVTVAQMGSCGYGSVTMERSFRDCSISSAGSNTGVGGSISHYNSGWFGIDPYSASYTSLFGKQKAINQLTKEEEEEEDEEEEEEEEEESATAGTETLPLFPIQRDDINNAFCNIRQYNPSCSYYSNWSGSYDDHANGGSHASLELSLKSFGTGKSPDSL